MKLKILPIIVLVTLTEITSAQLLTLKAMVDATECKTEDCFKEVMTQYEICHKRTRTDATGIFYRHQNCGADSTSDKRLVVHFAILNDGHYNSSFLTWSKDYADQLYDELIKYHFVKIEVTDDPSPYRSWFHSEDYPLINIMWEELIDDKQVKRWHVGLVWEGR
jgi:hypothetical protein